jgi:RNA polymerase sigma-70 factor (ECF subfamily)
MRRNVRKRIEAYAGRLFGYALTLTQDHHAAEDLTQDAMVRALAARRVPTDEPAFRAWLFRILRNRFIDEGRRHGRNPVPLDDLPPTAEAVEEDFSDQVISVVTVRMALARLALPHREILSLVDIGGLSYDEAADVLQVPAGTVMSRISRARRALAVEISGSNVRPMLRRGQG